MHSRANSTFIYNRKYFLPEQCGRKRGCNLVDVNSLSSSRFLRSTLVLCEYTSVRTSVLTSLSPSPLSHVFQILLSLPPSLPWQERKGRQKQEAERKTEDMQQPHYSWVQRTKDILSLYLSNKPQLLLLWLPQTVALRWTFRSNLSWNIWWANQSHPGCHHDNRLEEGWGTYTSNSFSFRISLNLFMKIFSLSVEGTNPRSRKDQTETNLIVPSSFLEPVWSQSFCYNKNILVSNYC